MIRFILYLHLFAAFLLLGDVPCLFGKRFPVEDGLTLCNNVENLCGLPVNEILFGMVHNAMSSPSAGFYFFANHMNDPIVESLDAGKYEDMQLKFIDSDRSLLIDNVPGR